MSTQAQVRTAQSQGARASFWLRAFALLVALLALSAQQRSLTSQVRVRASGSVARVLSEHVQHVQSDALRTEASVHAAPGPVFARPPCLPPSLPAVRWPSLCREAAPANSGELGQGVSHFHSKRRIPRMNSEEPPRV